MAVETELKLSIALRHLNRLKRHPLLQSLAIARAVTHRVHSVYFDTPALDLLHAAMALRLRRVGGRWLQTLKGGGSVQVGLHLRDEWELPVPGAALDLDALRAAGGRLPRGVRRKLQPVFTTDFSRNQRLLKFEGAEIELALDSGEISAGRNVRPVSELELELKSGPPQKLFKLAGLLLDIVPLEIESASKAEYGYLLCSGAAPAARKATFPGLDRSQDIRSALHSMIASCLQHVQANVPGAVRNLDEEYLHQVRVGLRRLRVVLALTESLHADAELGALHEQVAALCIGFGRLREWDVFVTQTLAPVCARLPDHAGLRMLLQASEKQRALHHGEVVRALQSPDHQRFLLRFGAWMQGASRQGAAADGGPGLADFAVEILEKRSRQVARRGKRLGVRRMTGSGRSASMERAAELHTLRIACKKLRYSAEMLGSLFSPAGTRRYVDALAALQDILGNLNDIAVARRLLDGMDNRDNHLTLELVRGWLEHDHAYLINRMGKAWKRFARQQEFWS